MVDHTFSLLEWWPRYGRSRFSLMWWPHNGRHRILTSSMVGRGVVDPTSQFDVVAAGWSISHSRFQQCGRGVVDPASHFFVVCCRMVDSAFSLLAWWTQSGRPRSSHLCGGRSMVGPAFLLPSRWPRSGRSGTLPSILLAAEWSIPHSHY